MAVETFEIKTATYRVAQTFCNILHSRGIIETTIDGNDGDYIVRYSYDFSDRLRYVTRLFKDRYEKRYSDIPTEVMIINLAAHDPSKHKIYVQWMMGMIVDDYRHYREDFGKVRRYLEMFDANKHLIANKDIYSYRSINDLYDAVEPFLTKIRLGDGFKSMEPTMLEQSEVILDDDRCRILIPNTEEASCYFGHSTEWCTAYGGKWSRYTNRDDNRFADYSKEGPLYIVADKVSGKRVQLHFESSSFMDEDDRPIIPDFDAF